jgi:mRNA-degrading endonuclease RelE of RelBE toxin-antitoxin system
MMFAKVVKTNAFRRDLKKLAKRFPTIADDLETFVRACLLPYHKMNIDNHGIFPLTELGFTEPPIFKTKKSACRSVKGKGVHSGIRVIHAYQQKTDSVELIQIYYKGDAVNYDRERICSTYR